jgi:membrane protein required for colicin V production
LADIDMEVFDIVLIAILVAATVFGAIKGFAWQLTSIASIVVSYAVAYKFREPLSQSIDAAAPWNRFLAMLILFVGTSLLIWVIFRMVRRSIDRLKLHEFDQHVGAVFGLLKGGLYCVLLTLFAVTLAGDKVRSMVVQSRGGHAIAGLLTKSEAVIPPEVLAFVDPYLQKFDTRWNEVSEEQAIDQTRIATQPSPQPWR